MQVLLDGSLAGGLERNIPQNLTLEPSTVATADGDTRLDILVHHLGRVNFGCIWDFKGLVFPDVKLNGEVLTGWRVFPLELNNLEVVDYKKATQHVDLGDRPKGQRGPVIYRGTLEIDPNTARGHTGHLPDTYVKVRGWGKGLVFVNGVNLGWYWPTVGPQGAQYVPGPFLKPGVNEFVMVEVEAAARAQSVDLTAQPDLSGPTQRAVHAT